jgi:hypothetical protein
MQPWSRVWCRVVRQAVGAPMVSAVCVLSLSAPAMVFWLAFVAVSADPLVTGIVLEVWKVCLFLWMCLVCM